MVTEISSIEHESHVQTPSNYYQRIKIANTKSKSKTEEQKSHSTRPTLAITENYVDAQSENLVKCPLKCNRKGFWDFMYSHSEKCEKTNYRKFGYKLNIK